MAIPYSTESSGVDAGNRKQRLCVWVSGRYVDGDAGRERMGGKAVAVRSSSSISPTPNHKKNGGSRFGNMAGNTIAAAGLIFTKSRWGKPSHSPPQKPPTVFLKSIAPRNYRATAVRDTLLHVMKNPRPGALVGLDAGSSVYRRWRSSALQPVPHQHFTRSAMSVKRPRSPCVKTRNVI